ncbi:bifunctional [glutamine synthetase] adenylyltransferase/[glutamine synthetase]-adenylyl-L-tyrosine phosphorylase, partial [Rhodococcus sp. NPDC058514]
MVKPPTARSTIPSVGRLGLVEPTAADELTELDWANPESLELLWALSRAANADLALRTLVRVKDRLGDDWAELDAELRTDTALRGRLFGLIGASSAFGDHIVADPVGWRLLAGEVSLPSRDELTDELLASVKATPDGSASETNLVYRAGVTGPAAIAALRKTYRDQLMVLAASDLAATVENEPVLPYQTVGRQLSDMADAALTGALAVAVAEIYTDGPCPARLAVIAMGKCGARELNYV